MKFQRYVNLLKTSVLLFCSDNGLDTKDWKDRMEAMKKIQSIVVTTKITKFPNFIQCMNKLHIPLTAQMIDQRSQLIKEAGKTISILAEVLQDDFEPLAIKFISSNSLIKLVQNTNKIISDQGHISVLAILYNVVSYKLVSKIYEEIRNKNPHVRMKIAQYFLVILNSYPEEVLEKQLHLIEDFLLHDLSDAKHEVRQIARMCFLVFKEVFPSRAKQMFPTLDFSVQKAILDEDENTVKESFSRLSMPSRSKDPNDTQRTYQHFYGGEKNPKLLADETNEQSQPAKIFGNKVSVQSEHLRKHPLSEQNLDQRELITPHPEGAKTSKNFVDIPKNDTSFEQMLGKESDHNLVPQFSKQIKTKTQASQQDEQRASRTSEEVKSKLKCLKNKQIGKKNQSSYSNFSNSNNQEKDDESISSIQEVSNQISIISDARKIRDFEDSGSVQDSIKNKISARVVAKKQNFFSTGNDTRISPNEYGGLGSGDLRQVSGGSELNQQIQLLLEKAQKENWSERLDAFYGIQYILNDWLMIVGEASANNQKLTIQQLNVTPENLKLIMQCLTDHLSDSHFKVVIVVQESLCSLFQVFHEIFHPYLPKLIQKLLKNVTDKKEAVCLSANVLLNLFQQIFGGDQLVPILLKLLEKSQQIQNKVLISCLEVLMVLLKDAYQYSMIDENVKACVLKISVIAGENSANKSITLPIIGALLTLRDKNLKATMMSLSQLDNKNLDIIKRLSHFYAPDLEENICEHVYHILENQEPAEESPRILEEKKNKLLARNQHTYPIDVPIALNSKNEISTARKNFEEEKSTRSQIEKKLGDVDVNFKEDDEDIMSFLLLESQIKKLVSATAPEQYLSEIFTSPMGYKWIISQNNEVKFDFVKKLFGLVSDKNQQVQFWNDHLQDVFYTLIGILNYQVESLDKRDDSSNELQSLKEQSFEVLKQIIIQFFTQLFEILKTPQKNSILDSLVESIILNYHENKYLSKKAEQVFDQLIQCSSTQQQFLSYISKSLMKFNLMQKKQPNCLSAIIKFQTKTIKNQNKQYFMMHAQDVFNNLLSPNINHQNAEVRKNVVFCLVEMRILMGVEDFKPFYEKMPISQQKLVNIYIERKNSSNGYSPQNLSQTTSQSQQSTLQQSQTGGKIL